MTEKTDKIVTLFGGSLDLKTPAYYDTIAIGHILAEKGYSVMSGGYGGMMEAVSKGVTEGGMKAIGVTCATFPSTKGNEFLSETVVANDIHDRLRHLTNPQHYYYIAQVGGLGTFAEVFLTLDIIRKKSNSKGKMILVGSHWKPIFESLKMYMTPKESDLLVFIEDSNGLKTILP